MQKNPAYSLRSFAKFLGIHHAILSLCLRNKRPFTSKSIASLGKALRLSPEKVDSFIRSNKKQRTVVLTDNEFGADSIKINNLTYDSFNIISEWYHDAIIELTRVRYFRSDPKWIAQTLGISLFETQAAIERLQRLGFIKIDQKSRISETLGDSTTSLDQDFTNAALKNYQMAALDRSEKALEEIPVALRDHSSMTMALSSKDLPKAKKIIKEFRIKIMHLLQSERADFDSVYQLTVSLYPLTKDETGELK